MKTFVFGFIACLLFLLLGAIVFAWSGLFPLSAKGTPPRWERRIAGFAVNHSIARQSNHPANPLPVTEANLEKGMKIYRDNCASCHGDALKRSKWGTTSFYPRVPQLGRKASDLQEWQIFWIVKNGIRYTGMASFEPLLTDNEMWQVTLFLHQLDSLPSKVNQEWHTPMPSQMNH